MIKYNVVAASSEATVVAEYVHEGYRSKDYQSEADFEKDFIKRLSGQGYEYICITKESELIANLRHQLEKLNNFKFSNSEWGRFFAQSISCANEGIAEKTQRVQEDYIQILKRDDGSTKNVYLIDKKNIHNNYLQALNQYKEEEGTHKSRYDATILVNGLPLVHVELKRRGIAIREAFNQIKRYLDMPPGTGDVSLTIFQSIKLDELVVVTSPQDLVSMVVSKAVRMSEKMSISVLGLVENMSYFQCPDCKSIHKIFGDSNIEKTAKEHGLEVLAQIPMDPRISTACDRGMIELFEGDWFDGFTQPPFI